MKEENNKMSYAKIYRRNNNNKNKNKFYKLVYKS